MKGGLGKNMKKLYWVPLLLVMTVLMVGSAAATFDIYWNCPQTGTSSTNTVVKDYMTYTDDVPFVDCQKSGNNFTIEFQVVGVAADWLPINAAGDQIGSGANTTTSMNATLFLYKGDKKIFQQVVSTNITNTSGTTTDLQRWTDFGELYTTGIVGSPKWYNNITEGGYKWYIEFWNQTDLGTSNEQILSSEKGAYSGSPVHFTIDHRGSSALKSYAAAQAGAEGTEELQAMFGGLGLAGFGGGGVKLVLLMALGVVVYWYLFRKKN